MSKGLFAALKAAGVASMFGVLVLGAGPALADPDPAPGDPGVVAPPGPPAPPGCRRRDIFSANTA